MSEFFGNNDYYRNTVDWEYKTLVPMCDLGWQNWAVVQFGSDLHIVSGCCGATLTHASLDEDGPYWFCHKCDKKIYKTGRLTAQASILFMPQTEAHILEWLSKWINPMFPDSKTEVTFSWPTA